MQDQTFTGIDLTNAHPPGICADCAQHGLEHVSTGDVFVYCHHAMTSASRAPGDGWQTQEGITLQFFQSDVITSVVACEQFVSERATRGMTEQ